MYDTGDRMNRTGKTVPDIHPAMTTMLPTGGEHMNRLQLIDAAAAKSGFSKREISYALDAVLETITATVASGDKVTLAGFGSFEKVERPARTARNPRTGEAVDVPAKAAPAFKAATAFKTTVNG